MQHRKSSATRTRVARVRAEYPNQLDYSGGDVLIVVDCTLAFLKHFWLILKFPNSIHALGWLTGAFGFLFWKGYKVS